MTNNLAPIAIFLDMDDLDADIVGALNAGMTAVWVDYFGSGLPEGTSLRPHHVIPHSGHVRLLIEPLRPNARSAAL